MAERKYSEYVKQDTIVFSVFKEVPAPQFQILGERHLEGAPLTVGWSLLIEPFIMIPKSHKHDYNQIICFMGGDPNDIRNFDAVVEFSLGEEEEVQVITSTSFVWIPRGLAHGPLNIKTVNKPIMFMDIVMNATQPGVVEKFPPKQE
jgi:hypothetical protein